MTADGPKAHGYLLGFEPLSHYGACWYYVWQAYAKAGASTNMGSYQTALQAWYASSGKHYDMNPPEGAAIWLGERYDGEQSGDVFIAGASDGQHAATDQPTYGLTGETTIRARMNLTGREYLGWTDHVLDCPIKTGGGTQPPDPDTEEETMLIITSPNRKPALVAPGFYNELTDEEAANPICAVKNGNDRQYDLWKSAIMGMTVQPGQNAGGVIISSPNRSKAIVGPGYYRVLSTDEEADAASLYGPTVTGNDRQYDLWKSLAVSGSGPAKG